LTSSIFTAGVDTYNLAFQIFPRFIKRFLRVYPLRSCNSSLKQYLPYLIPKANLLCSLDRPLELLYCQQYLTVSADSFFYVHTLYRISFLYSSVSRIYLAQSWSNKIILRRIFSYGGITWPYLHSFQFVSFLSLTFSSPRFLICSNTWPYLHNIPLNHSIVQEIINIYRDNNPRIILSICNVHRTILSKLKFFITLFNFLFHPLGARFNPYSPIFAWHPVFITFRLFHTQSYIHLEKFQHNQFLSFEIRLNPLQVLPYFHYLARHSFPPSC